MNQEFSVFEVPENCCGCSACSSVCPKQAISMVQDEKGFLYPKVDMEHCIHCQRCEKVCAFQKESFVQEEPLSDNLIFAAKHKQLQERLTSRSGGVFATMSNYILQKNGVVYGAAFDDSLKVVHKRTESWDGIMEMKGSKYVQSDLNNTFRQVKEDLLQERYVLFSGTPCQTAGLLNAVASLPTEKLFVCDIVCHGTPSSKIYADYLHHMEQQKHRKVIAVNFRDKSFGWAAHIESFQFENRKRVYSNLYTNLFCEHIMFRPSCGNCKYTSFHRPSDLTLGDFWGIDKCLPTFNDNRGVSLVIVNTEKGKQLFEAIQNDLDVEPSRKEDCMQPNLQNPSVFSPQTDDFWLDYQAHGFAYVAKKYGRRSLYRRLRFRTKILLFRLKKRG